jgi:hypothetical protein
VLRLTTVPDFFPLITLHGSRRKEQWRVVNSELEFKSQRPHRQQYRLKAGKIYVPVVKSMDLCLMLSVMLGRIDW